MLEITTMKAVRNFDYLNAGEVYNTWPIDLTHTRFWNVEKDCGTFIANWQVEHAIASGAIEVLS